MQVLIQSQVLKNNLIIVRSALASSFTAPILSNFLMEFTPNQLKITGTDLEVTLTSQIECECIDSKRFCVEAEKLIELVKAIKSEPINLKIEKQEIEITTTSGTYNMPISDANEFPKPIELEEAKGLSIPSYVLSSALSKTSFAVGINDMRPALNGVCFDMKKDSLVFVATDANRLVKYTRTDLSSEEENKFILPKKTISVLKTALSGLDVEVKMTYNKSNVCFVFEHFVIKCLLIDANYPNYEGVIPKENPNTILIQKSELQNALKRINVFSNRETHQISLDKKQNSIVLSAEDKDYSNKGVETLFCQTDGDDMKIGFNSKFLLEILSNSKEGDIKLSMSQPNRAGIITPTQEDSEYEETLMLVMPVMLAN